MRIRPYITSALTVMTALSALPGRAVAQTVSQAAAPLIAISRADQLEKQAAALHDDMTRYVEAARLYKQAASLRSETDPRAVDVLMLAAHLFHYANKMSDARKTMDQAAQRALAGGDVWRASVANLEAALFAYKQGNWAQTERLGRKALQLAQSPLLTEEQRASIVNRLTSNPAVAGLAN
jgi:tetratricopeptide (TPR) repeat protein